MSKPAGLTRGIVFVALLLAAVAAAPSWAEAETLYGLERNGPNLRTIERAFGADIATISSSVTGSWRGMAMDPRTGVMYASDSEYLFTIDLTTGATTQIGLFGSVLIRDLTFDDLGQLYGISGNNGANQHSLHVIDTATGSAAVVVALGGINGHGIAYDPDQPGTLYHIANGVFERVDLSASAITPIGLSGDPIVGRPLGLVYDPLDGLFRFFDETGRYYAVDRDGTVTAAGTQNPTRYFGLAFDQRTTEVILFRDGFEGGNTDAWSGAVP